MLHENSVSQQLLGILKTLMNTPEFKDLYLVGGTSLALQIGHRVSIDIDMFGKIELDEMEITSLISKLGTTTLLNRSKNIFIYSIDTVKVDIVNYPFDWIEKPIQIGGIRLAGKKDIAAMKLNAIAGRGSKKDFIDLFFLLKEYELKEMLNFYKQKYPNGSVFSVLKSLAYFDDADTEPSPKMLDLIEWGHIKSNISELVKKHLT